MQLNKKKYIFKCTFLNKAFKNAIIIIQYISTVTLLHISLYTSEVAYIYLDHKY